MSKAGGRPTSRRSASPPVEPVPASGSHSQVGQRNFADRVASLSAPAHRVHQVILRAFLEHGCAPTVADLRPAARASGIGLERLLAELAVHDVIQRTADGAIAVAYPFSGTPTAHQVQLEGGPTVFAMCIIDALGLPFMARRAVTIRTQDPFDATPITVVIGCGPSGTPVSSQVHWLPAAAVVLVDTPPTGPVIQAECSCPYLNAFASRETAQRWRATHADLDVQLLTQQRAVREARKIFGAVLQKAPAADTWVIPELVLSSKAEQQPAGRRKED
jgi:hypothetical protein